MRSLPPPLYLSSPLPFLSKEFIERDFCCSSECCEDIDDDHIQPHIVNVDANVNEIDPISFSGETEESKGSGEDRYKGGGKDLI